MCGRTTEGFGPIGSLRFSVLSRRKWSRDPVSPTLGYQRHLRKGASWESRNFTRTLLSAVTPRADARLGCANKARVCAAESLSVTWGFAGRERASTEFRKMPPVLLIKEAEAFRVTYPGV